jgi:sulfate ABC transporter permease protein CysT/sulfate ABC transporter permease protein CysW
MLSLVVLIPIVSVVIYTSGQNFSDFWETITSKRLFSAYKVSFFCAFVATIINSVFGVILAWVLVRYDFPFKRFMDGLIELPFALPTSVAGITLTTLYSQNGWFGKIFAKFGIRVSYTKIGIIIAMIFIGIPFIVRNIQPVLEKFDRTYEEAGEMFGASRSQIFFKIIFPEIVPPLLTGFGLAFARALGEYGSVVFIAGNKPYETEVVPLLIMSKLQQFDYTSATAIALVMLLVSFTIMFITNSIQLYTSKFNKGMDTNTSNKSVPNTDKGIVKWLLIILGALFLIIMLIVPIIAVVHEALSGGLSSYVEAVTDKYTVSSVKLTLLATFIAVIVNTFFGLFASWTITKFKFTGKKILSSLIDIPLAVSPVIAGLVFILTYGRIGWANSILKALDIKIVFSITGIILATIFVTFPFISREIIPMLNSIGNDEEEMASIMGANAWTIFSKITFPHIKWALLYGIVLCTARAMGEFGAVSVISGHLRGKTTTMPLHIEILYNEFKYVDAFAVSSILVLFAIIILIVKSIVEYKGKKD